MASKAEPFPQTLLARAHPPSVAEDLYNERIVKRPLYLRPTSPTPSARAVRRKSLNERKIKARARSKLKPRPLSAAQKRSLGFLELPREQQKYDLYLGLHTLWCGYMAEILGLGSGTSYVTAGSAGQQLASADMHGAIIEVVRSRCPSRVGLKGIVVRDSKFTFEIVTEKDKVKTVPKEHTMFRYEVPVPAGQDGEEKEKKPLVFEILGEQFQCRGADRANRKFRMHYQRDV